MRWQTRRVLERYGSLESLEAAMQVYQESMRHVYIEAGVSGGAMLVAAALMFRHRILGWRLWIACLAIPMGVTVVGVSVDGASAGAILRLCLLSTFAFFSVRAYRSTAWQSWFDQKAAA